MSEHFSFRGQRPNDESGMPNTVDPDRAEQPGSEVIELFFVLNSAEHEIFSADKYEKCQLMLAFFIFISIDNFTRS